VRENAIVTNRKTHSSVCSSLRHAFVSTLRNTCVQQPRDGTRFVPKNAFALSSFGPASHVTRSVVIDNHFLKKKKYEILLRRDVEGRMNKHRGDVIII
jgi:hypothetical protein